MADAAEATTIVIVEEQDFLRQGLESYFEQREDFEVVGAIEGCSHAALEISGLNPQIVLLGISSQEDGAEFCDELVKENPDIKIVALVAPGGEAGATQAVRHGARAVLSANTMARNLVEAIYLVSKGQVVVPDSVVRGAFVETDNGSRYGGLSIRELEVLQLMANGLRNKEIAAQLYLSEVTVKTHASHIFRKLAKTNRTSAILHAHRQGWISLLA